MERLERISYGTLGELVTTLVEVDRGKRVVLASVVLSNVTEEEVSFHCYVSMTSADFHICPRGMILEPGATVVLQFPVALESRDRLVGYSSVSGAVRYYITGTIQGVIPQPT